MYEVISLLNQTQSEIMYANMYIFYLLYIRVQIQYVMW